MGVGWAKDLQLKALNENQSLFAGSPDLLLSASGKSVHPAGLSKYPSYSFQELATRYCLVVIFFSLAQKTAKGFNQKEAKVFFL